MGHTVTIRLTKELAAWLERASKRSVRPRGRTIREQLEKARESGARPSVMRLAGCVRGARDLSTRQGFSRPRASPTRESWSRSLCQRSTPRLGDANRGQRHGAAPHLRGSPRENGLSPRSASVAFAMLNEGLVALAFGCREHFIQLTRLADRYCRSKARSCRFVPREDERTVREAFRDYRRSNGLRGLSAQ